MPRFQAEIGAKFTVSNEVKRGAKSDKANGSLRLALP